MSIKVRSSYAQVTKDFVRLRTLPERAKRSLDSVLNLGFKAVQADTHVGTTGNLKASERKGSIWWDNSWHGEISVGSPGGKPVDYAIYEKARGAEHDFLKPTDALDPLFLAAILKTL